MNFIKHKLIKFPELFALSALIIVEIIWAPYAKFALQGTGPTVFCAIVLLIVSYLYGRSSRSPTLSEMAYFGAVMILSGVANLALSYLVARWSFTLVDAQLVAADAALGLSLPTWFLFLGMHPVFDAILKIAYDSLILQFCFSIMYFTHATCAGKNKEMFWIVTVSSVLTSVVSGLLPALGAHSYFHVFLDRAVHLNHLEQLRQPGDMALRLTQLEGIITMPSYHTVLALVFTYLHRGTRVVFPLILALNTLVLISTPTYGGHYFVDLIAGAMVAVASVYLVRLWEQKWLCQSAMSNIGVSLHRRA